MIGDLFSLTVNIACPDSPASFALWYRETQTFDSFTFATEAIAESFDDLIAPALQAFMSTDFFVVSFTCRKHFNLQEAKFRRVNALQPGLRPGPGLPANNAVVVSLAQGQFPATSNGRIFLPGFAEADVNVDNISAAMKILVEVFADGLLNGLPEPSPGNGAWELGVISDKVLRVENAPPAWADSFAPVESISCSPIIKTQRRRTTPIIGQSIAP